MQVDTTTKEIEIVDERPSPLAEEEQVPAGNASTWKQEVVSVNPLVGKLLQPEFDQANFLYNMYKSCTVGEIEDFKISLQQIREGTVVGASRDCVTSKSNQIAQLVKDMIQLDTEVKLRLVPSINKLDETSLRIKQSLLAQIRELQSQASRLVMTQKCEEIIRESQLVYECLQKVSYAYSFAQKKILDPLSLSVALKKLSVLSSEQKKKLAANIPQVADKLQLLEQIQSLLERQTLAKFQEAFDNKDRQTLVQCIQVFFNMEILADQIQQRTNVYLKQLHMLWQKSIKDLNDQIQKQDSLSAEAQLVDRTMAVFIEQMSQATMKVYHMSLALSEQDPTSAAATSFEAMQETLQQTGLANVFRLYWDMLCKIMRIRLQAASTDYPYVYSAMASRYPAFILSLKHFWEQVLSQIQPTDKIRLLELKQSLFTSADVLKQHYFDNHIIKQLMEHRLQISEVLTHSLENLEKYKIVAQKPQAEAPPTKIVNPYAALADSIEQSQDLRTQEKTMLAGSISDLLTAIHWHLKTVNSQLDLRNQVIEICKGQLSSLLQTDLLSNIVKIQVTNETQDYEHQLAFNMVIFGLTKQVAQYFSSTRFQELLEADKKLQSTSSSHVSKQFDLKLLQQEAQDMCCKLFEKVYSVFVSHLKTKIYPALARIFLDMPKPLQEDDLDFGGGDDANEADGEEAEEIQNHENSKSFTERLDEWSQLHCEELLEGFIPECVKDFNADFEGILEQMNLEKLSTESAQCDEWIRSDRKARMVECVDEILHFYLIRAIQMDFSSFSEQQRIEVYHTFVKMYKGLVSALNAFVEINCESRMVRKHQQFLAIVKDESGLEESRIPYHLRLCTATPSLKTISVRNLYICERSKRKADMLGQSQLAKNAAATYERTLLDIKKAIEEQTQKNKDNAQMLIEQEEKLEMINCKIASINAKITE